MNKITKQIIAIGGAGWGMNPIKKPDITQYILEQSEKQYPNICYIPTASAENKQHILDFYRIYSQLDCTPTHISLFQRTPRLNSIFNKQDIIYVGGGNTKSMLAVWREWQLDVLLKKAYNRGTILAGVSAGSICWFEQGITDSWLSNLNLISCLGFLNGAACPHYDVEESRKPTVHQLIGSEKIDGCLAMENGTGLHFCDGKLYRALSWIPNAKSYKIEKTNGRIIETAFKMQEVNSVLRKH